MECSHIRTTYAARDRYQSLGGAGWNADASTPIIRTPLAETPFEDGTFRLVLTFEETYPNRPPTVKFM